MNTATNSSSQQWRVLAWLNFLIPAMFFGYEYLLRVLPSILFTTLHQQFVVSATQMSFVLSWYYYAYALMQIPAGLLVDRYGSRLFIGIGLVTCMLGSMLLYSASSIYMVGLARILMGLGGAFSFVSCVRLICLWFAPEQFVFLTGLAVMIGTSGAIFAHVTIAPSLSVYGLGHTFLWILSLGLILLYAVFQFIREPERDPVARSQRAVQTQALFRNKSLWVLALYAFLLTAPTSSFAALWGTSFLVNVYHFTLPQSASYIGLVFLGWVIGAPLFSLLGRRQQYAFRWMALAALCSAVMLLTLLLHTLQHLWLLSLLLFCFGFFSAGVVLSYTGVREFVGAEHAAAAGGFVNLFAMMAAVFTQPFIGVLLDGFSALHHEAWQSFGSLHLALLILPVFQVAALLMILMSRRHHT